MQPITEKRRHERYLAVCNTKVFDAETRRYRAGQSLNLSTGGALLAIRHGEQLREGQLIRVAIESNGAEGLVRRGDMVDARVVRNEGVGGNACVIAVQYAEPQTVAVAA